MAKASNLGKGDARAIENPRPPEFSKEPPKHDNSPQARQTTSSDLFGRLSGLGKGWDPEMEALLAPPGTLFLMELPASVLYSKEPEFEVAATVNDIIRGTGDIRKPKTEYGLAIYETASTLYLVFVDMQRRIIVRERLSSLHDEPREDAWGPIKSAIKGALRLAESSKKGIAVSDGSLRLVTFG